MSESMERSRQATSGWRRTSIAAFSALFAFIFARVVLRRRPALPAATQRANAIVERDNDALDRQIRLRMPVTMARAPSEFTAKVLTRIATSPAPQRQLVVYPAPRVSWLW